MAVAENAVPKSTSDSNNGPPNDLDHNSKPSSRNVDDVDVVVVVNNPKESNFDHPHTNNNDDDNNNHHSLNGNNYHLNTLTNNPNTNGFDVDRHQQHHAIVSGGVAAAAAAAAAESNGHGRTNNQIQVQNQRVCAGLNDMTDLAEILSNLNPMAEEFVPPSLSNTNNNNSHVAAFLPNVSAFPTNYVDHAAANGFPSRRKKNHFCQGRRRTNARTSMAQREEIIRRTVYVSDIDQQVTEEQLASLFIQCGLVVDCRICGDPNSVLRFAFIEFTDEDSAHTALNLSGTVLGFYPVRVLPSKTAIAPVNPTFLPRSEDEREMCARTVYCTNIDKKVSQTDVRLFFESFCGEVHRLRLLGDYHHATRIAFVEFALAESAIAALNCSGAVLGSLPIRVSPSKTPVRPRVARSHVH